MSKGIVLTLSFLITPSEASVFNFSHDHEIGQPYQLVYSVLIIHCAQYRPTGYPILPIVQFPFLNAKADAMPAKTDKSMCYILLRLASMY